MLKFNLALDDQDIILNEYRQSARAKPKQEAIVRQIVGQIINFGNKGYVKKLRCDLPKPALDVLQPYGCDKSIERELFGLSINDPQVYVVYLPGGKGTISRGYSTNMQHLNKKGLGTNFIPVCEAVDALEETTKVFHSSKDIENFLDIAGNKTGDKRGEHECLEFKGSSGILRHEQMIRVVEAVCAMLNKGGGWVFLGVQDDGTVDGIEQKYKSSSDPPKDHNADSLQRIVAQEIGRIRPNALHLVSVSSVDIGNNRIVIPIFVRGSERRYIYGGIEWIRVGTASVKR